MGLLESNQLSLIRKQYGDFIIYNMKTQNQIDVLTQIAISQLEINGEENKTINIGCEVIRKLLRNFTNIADEIDNYSDLELQKIIDEGNNDLKDTIDEVMDIVKEFLRSYHKKLKFTLEMVETKIDSLEIELLTESIKKKMELEGISSEDFQKMLQEALAGKNNIKKPQDHKKSTKPKAKKNTKIKKDKIDKESVNNGENI